jgi:alginate O-acetyltransferase complex protein AlgI
MLFNTFRFILVFAPAFLLGFYALRRQSWRVAFTALASYAFYGYANRFYPFLLLAATGWSWGAGLLMGHVGEGRRKAAMWLGIAGPLALLAVFKYSGFLADDTASLVETLTGRGLPSLHTFAHGIVLPVGISFYTFEAISYVVDVHRRRIEPEPNILRFATFMAYFPHLIAGPIVRYERLGPQLRRFHRFDSGLFFSGVVLFAAGLAKKVLIADTLATFPDQHFAANPATLHFLDGWVALLAFAGQIYFDFSGYTDMALGLSRMIGIDLPWNFDRPARAAHPAEFWNRWNVTLSRWLRDYLYVPLNHGGGGRHRTRARKQARRDWTLLLTMAIAGLWHGASLNFLCWGLYVGILVVVVRRIGARTGWQLPHWTAVACTYVAMTFGGVLFRVRDMSRIPETVAALFGLHGLGSIPPAFTIFLALTLIYTLTVPEEWRWQPLRWPAMRLAALATGAGAVVGIAFVWMIAPPHPFVYFQF